jgi:NADPH-dependent F420 reductase
MDHDAQRVSVIGGTGPEGRGIALRLAMTGLEVCVGSRDAARAASAATALAARLPGAVVTGTDNAGAIAASAVVVLSVPFRHAAETIEANRAAFAPGTLVIDVTVPVVFERGRPTLVAPAEGSASEHLRARLPEEVRLACAFKTIPARLLEQLERPLDCDEFVCGDSIEARERTSAILRRVPGLRPIDAGGLEAARAVEHMTWLAILLNKRYKSHEGRFRVAGI